MATTESVVTHATLSDGPGSDDLLGIAAASPSTSLPKSISAILLQSMNEGSHVLLTHLSSRGARPSANSQGRESLVLVPTRETTAVVVTEDHPFYPQKGRPVGEGENAFASQLLTSERASQLFSMTQQTSGPHADPVSPAGGHRGMMAVVAPLTDIIIDGVDASFVEGSHWRTPARLSEFLIDCPSISTGLRAIRLRPSYRSATLVLDPLKVSREMMVNADGDALKMLCMDVPAEDMMIGDDDSQKGATRADEHPYLGRVGEMLRALCAERVPIRWVLEQESERNWFVTNATLVEI